MNRKKKHALAAPGKLKVSPGVVLALALFAIFAGGWLFARKPSHNVEIGYKSHRKGELTFSKNIAPVMFEHCAPCHRPGQSAPFSLLTYRDVRKHAMDIVEVTQRRYMPPWPPEAHGQFVGERALSVEQLGIIAQWVQEGLAEGSAAELPPPPHWSSDWQMGPPDFVATMPRPYLVPAEGRDIYRNFVVPLAVSERRFVRAVEFRPRSARVHHVLIRVDRVGRARYLEQKENEPGFPGITLSAEAPGGNFLTWQPGKMAVPLPNGLSWEVNPGDDLIFQMHMTPAGKPEPIQSEIGLYFTDQPPTKSTVRVLLTSSSIDIPAGKRNHTVRDEYKLPVDLDLLAILPHAHYLAKEVEGTASFPDGTVRSLLLIKDWDFNWQSDYQYKTPLFLPKGTLLSMKFTFDNSTDNIRNPSSPPKRVTAGRQSTDEMAELWFQLLPRNKSDIPAFQQDYGLKVRKRMIEGALFALKKNPLDAPALASIGMIDYGEGRLYEAEQRFSTALRSDPRNAAAHYGLGLIFRRNNRLAEARAEFVTSLESDPWSWQAHGNLGMICLELSDFDCAEKHFGEALRLNPADALAENGLREAINARSRSRY